MSHHAVHFEVIHRLKTRLHGAVPQFPDVVGVDLSVLVQVQRRHHLILDLGIVELNVPHVA